MKKVFIYTLVFSLISFPLAAFAHSGGTDTNGCHTDRKTGEYHCHTSKTVKVEARKTARTSARTDALGNKNCADFLSHADAQTFFEKTGGPFVDPHDLDRDNDGVACEALM